MSAMDHLNDQQFHGTTHRFKSGEQVEVGHPNNYQAEPFPHVYSSSSKGEAMDYAVQASWKTRGKPKVYEVTHTGPAEADPENRIYDKAVRTTHPMTVGKRVVYFPRNDRSTYGYIRDGFKIQNRGDQ